MRPVRCGQKGRVLFFRSLDILGVMEFLIWDVHRIWVRVIRGPDYTWECVYLMRAREKGLSENRRGKKIWIQAR